MKLTLKTVFALCLGLLVVLSIEGALRVQRQLSLFETDMRRDHASMGRMLSAVVSELMQSGKPDDAIELVEMVNRRHLNVQISWVQPEVAGGFFDEDALGELGAGKELTRNLEHADGERYLHSYIPVLSGSDLVGALELIETFQHQRQFVRITIIRTVLTTSVVIVLCTMMALGLGYVFVGKPVRRLVDKARRVGAGDFSGPIDLPQKDEMRILAMEMNAMSESLAEADRRLSEETAARIGALEQLRHADRLTTVGRLAAGIAHEIGTPLNVVSGRAKMISLGETTGEGAMTSARIIAEQADRITSIIRQLLNFARTGDAEKTDVDLRRIAAQTLELLAPMARKKGVELVLEADADPMTVRADASQIQQVVTNLVLNGIHAMDGSGKLVVALGRVEARPPGSDGGEVRHALFSVKDEGGGIAEEDLDRVFDPFFTTKPVGEGTGLGLSVSYGIVADHGGWIRVESTQGVGSTFSVYLPMDVQP